MWLHSENSVFNMVDTQLSTTRKVVYLWFVTPCLFLLASKCWQEETNFPSRQHLLDCPLVSNATISCDSYTVIPNNLHIASIPQMGKFSPVAFLTVNN